jgi:hypothetical protein
MNLGVLLAPVGLIGGLRLRETARSFYSIGRPPHFFGPQRVSVDIAKSLDQLQARLFLQHCLLSGVRAVAAH